MAESITGERAKEILGSDTAVTAESSGLSAEDGASPHPGCIEAIEKLRVPVVRTTARPVTEEKMRACHLAISMTRQQAYLLSNRYGEFKAKCFSLIGINGAIDTILHGEQVQTREEIRRESTAIGHEELAAALEEAASLLAGADRESLRPLAGVPMDIREVLTLFPTCFHQVSGIHDPVGGTSGEYENCARLIDAEVTQLLEGLLDLAVRALRS